MGMRRVAAVVAVGVITSSVLTGAAGITDQERQNLLSHMALTSSWLIDEVSGLSEAQTEFRPKPEAWSIAQVLEHLVVVAPIYWDDLQTALKQPAAGERSRMTDANVLWYGIDRTYHEQAIPTERAPGKLHDIHAGLEMYRKHHERLRQFIETTRDDLRAHIVKRQGSDAYQWALLISTHEQRHILQIREIKADPKFPRS
jgi:uncharacterized damage-inducible protein DinB